MSPRSMAFAYRIWGDCQSHGWDRTAAEIAENLGDTPARVARIVNLKGWSNRLRAVPRTPNNAPPAFMRIDAELESLSGDRTFQHGEYL